MAFAAVYLALPAITGAFLPEPISMFPLPFKDLTANTESFLPAVPIMLSFDLGLFISGMVLPFWAMVGSFVGLVVCIVANPMLYKTGILHTWAPASARFATIKSNTLDFYFSFGLGLTAAIAVIGFCHVGAKCLCANAKCAADRVRRTSFARPPGRGDFPIWAALRRFTSPSTTITILTAYLLLKQANLINPARQPGHAARCIGVFIFYGFVYTPIISYVSARMEGIVGM